MFEPSKHARRLGVPCFEVASDVVLNQYSEAGPGQVPGLHRRGHGPGGVPQSRETSR